MRRNRAGDARGRERTMRGYFTHEGYYGLVDGRYVQFASESDYFDYMEALTEAA